VASGADPPTASDITSQPHSGRFILRTGRNGTALGAHQVMLDVHLPELRSDVADPAWMPNSTFLKASPPA
jgi:hypothetical protein